MDKEVPHEVLAGVQKQKEIARAEEDEEERVKNSINLVVTFRGEETTLYKFSRRDTAAKALQAVYSALKLDKLEWDGRGGLQRELAELRVREDAAGVAVATGRSTTALSKKIACGSRLAWRKTVTGSMPAAASATRQPDGVIHVRAIHG
jgi:hypothetical protein